MDPELGRGVGGVGWAVSGWCLHHQPYLDGHVIDGEMKVAYEVEIQLFTLVNLKIGPSPSSIDAIGDGAY